MGDETTEDGRRPSMYDPARDIFAKGQEQDKSAGRDTTTSDTSDSHERGTAPIISQAIPSSHHDHLPTTTDAPPSTVTEPVQAKPEVKVASKPSEAVHQDKNRSSAIEKKSSPRPAHRQSSSSTPSSKLPTSRTLMSDSTQDNQPERQDQDGTAAAHPTPSTSAEKRKPTENEPAADTSNQGGRQHHSKRRRREERPQRTPRREGPSAYSRRDRSPQGRSRESRNSRSVSPVRRAADFRRSRSPLPRERSVTPEAEARQRKRPGGGARLGTAGKDLLRRRQEERELAQQRDVEKDLRDRGVHDVVRQHYNAVPERGREWRKTDSKIKGLRSFNNWIKSTIIQKFSPDEEFLSSKTGTKEWAADAGGPPVDRKKLLVVDLGCGKGGDLGKWQQAPQAVDLYVGLDPAEISIDQARERYNNMRNQRNQRNRRGNPLFHAEFYPKDCFGEWLGDLHIIQEVGIDANVGPNANLMNARWGGGGFDVVVSMFTMHYAFESEQKARQMLQNVAGALKKGGRFIGVGPNSDVISAKVAEYHKERKAEKEAQPKTEGAAEDGEVEEEEKLEWGNSIYRVRFPGSTPEDGVFRPPFGWKYSYFMEEAVEEIPEYVVPWEAFRYLTTEYNLELVYRKPFLEIWHEEKDDPELGPLSERMGVRARGSGELLVSEEELDAASFYHAFVFQKARRSRRAEDTEATPTPSVAAATTTSRNRPRTPEYEPLCTPLNAKAQRSLASLHAATHFRLLKEHIRQAGDKITETAGEANEHATDARYRFEKSSSRRKSAAKKKRKREKKTKNEDEIEDDEEENEERREEQRKLEILEAKVNLITAKLEEKMRRVVDAEYKVSGLQVAIQEIATDAETAGAALNTSRRRARLRQRGAVDDDEDEDMDGNEDEEEEDVPPAVVPSQMIKERLVGHESQWEQQSLTQRYTNNNAYVGFYRIVHDAKQPGNETPPVPHPSTWFNHLEPNRRPDTSRQQSTAAIPTNDEDDNMEEDEEIEIEKERISLKCPLTLVTFEDPVKSTKCIHSFERKAIEDMIRASSMTIPAGETDFQGGGGRNARARRVRAVPCPVCSVPMSLNDLEPNFVLVRRVRRMRAAELREQEDAELGSGRRNRNGVMIDSDAEGEEEDDDDDTRSEMQQKEEEVGIKWERPRSSSRALTAVAGNDEEDDEMEDVNNDDDDDEDAEEEEEEEEEEEDEDDDE
ncbi:mRNA cap methyltransferase [Talaromyces stipitatus ATCC 10500]|uniref:mRNA cap guanine-N(7) methyltransferase n=1 Tax=Talaromyces stipitatus (strain ATCC 10500 / CBS 375.48 / QM 6759 / NRRL 1006) TaxID=441959 RepID=B8LTJ5_TALSN|nr:mRNA cap methyltransferase [Talaromyces stipitatus ATCC 10500]EED23073.1 mRNA cap methyltransferase [Talaromyces stipitatus ATCC 10500]